MENTDELMDMINDMAESQLLVNLDDLTKAITTIKNSNTDEYKRIPKLYTRITTTIAMDRNSELSETYKDAFGVILKIEPLINDGVVLYGKERDALVNALEVFHKYLASMMLLELSNRKSITLGLNIDEVDSKLLEIPKTPLYEMKRFNLKLDKNISMMNVMLDRLNIKMLTLITTLNSIITIDAIHKSDYENIHDVVMTESNELMENMLNSLVQGIESDFKYAIREVLRSYGIEISYSDTESIELAMTNKYNVDSSTIETIKSNYTILLARYEMFDYKLFIDAFQTGVTNEHHKSSIVTTKLLMDLGFITLQNLGAQITEALLAIDEVKEDVSNIYEE